MDRKLQRIAIIWRNDWRTPDAPTKYEARLKSVRDALRAAQFEPVPFAFSEEGADALRQTLLTCAGALVWVNPIADGRDRTILDDILRDTARRGVWISAHPDVIAAMATKEVLHRLQDLGWGSDTRLYTSVEAFASAFDNAERQDRVLKPVRGNDGRGVTRIAGGPTSYALQQAAEDAEAMVTWDGVLAHVAAMFESTPIIIDQECHDARRGMVRCYMSFDQVIGFGEQAPRSNTHPFAMSASKAMHAADEPRFADLRDCMDKDWVPGMKRALSLETPMLPALWDADFLYRRTPSKRGSRYALCEINASCVSPFPYCAPIAIAHGLRKWVGASW